MNRIGLRRKYGMRHFGVRARTASRLLGTLLAPFCSLCLQLGAAMPAQAYTVNVSKGGTIAYEYVDGTQNVYSGGDVFSEQVTGRGSINIFSGGGARYTTATNGGSLLLQPSAVYGGISSTLLSAGGIAFILGGTAYDTNIYSSDSRQEVTTNGVASGTRAQNGGVESVGYGGKSVSAYLINGGTQKVFANGLVVATQVASGGSLQLSAYGSASSAQIGSGGSIIMSGGGTASSTTVSAGGYIYTSGGGTAIETSLAGLAIANTGGLFSATTIKSGGVLSAQWGGVASATTVQSGGILSVGADSNIYDTTVNSGGNETVAWHGVDSGTVVSSGGNLVVSSGGVTQGATLYAGANVSALSGAVISTAAVLSGAQLTVGAGVTTYANTVNNGGIQTVSSGGTASATSISSGGLVEVSSGGLAISSRISAGGSQTVFNGGVASGTVISIGGAQTVSSGGTAVSSLVFQGGVQNAIDGAIVIDTIDAGGTMNVGSGVNVTSTTVEADGVQNVLSGGIATSSTVIGGGVQNVSSGGLAQGTTLGDGVQNILDGGVASSTTIVSGGVQNVSSGGLAQGTIISDGSQNVFGGGVASSTSVSAAGVQNVSSGGTAAATTVDSGGTLNLYSAGTASMPVINNGGSLQVMENGVAPIDHLTLNGGKVSFNPTGGYKSLTVGVLDGSGGTFAMRENVAAEQGDLLVIGTSYSGKHTLDIANEGGAHADLAYRHKVVDAAGAAATVATAAVASRNLSAASTGSFSLSHLVEVGPYKYDLKQGSDGSWYLYTDSSAITDGNIGNDSKPGLTSTAVAGARTFGASFMLGQVENQTLSQRLGDVRNASGSVGAWVRAYGGRLGSDTGAGSVKWNESYSGVQVGADTARGGWVFGGLFGTTHATPDAVDGNAKVDSYYLGAYATHQDAQQRYIDLVAMAGTAKHDFSVSDTAGAGVSGNVSTPYYQLSGEVGQRFTLTAGGVYVEPQAQLTVQHQNSGSFTASDGLQVSSDAVNATLGRIGVALGLLRSDVEHPYNVYLKTSLQQQFDGNFNVDLNGTKLASDYTGSWLSYGAGFNVKLGKDNNSLAYGEVSRTASNGPVQQEWQLTLGLKYAW
ncbi:autotransporter outer membrane beta-barrel domain-containing protein [Paludibacterium yongneupense]|uniref:autotransporter outer membrane beta-barrel domain-containing protein n=3 Tax=Paludibacterium yongneupense TaxID=400061 RepID=UPI001C04EE08|nr:autotransporter outer membrane beta-barrel domain-containing protein [Paludibacterium yongneupense]